MARAVRKPDRDPGLLSTGLISLAGSGFAAAAALIVAVLVGRGFGPSGTGLFFQTIALFTVVVGILKLGTGSGLVRGLARARALQSHAPESVMVWWAIWPVLILSSTVGLVAYLGAPALASVVATPEQASDVTRILRILAPFIGIAAVLSVLHTAARMMRSVLSFTILQNVLVPFGRVLAVGVAVALGWEVVATVAAWAALLPLWLLVTLGCLYPLVREDLRRRRGGWNSETQHSFWRFTAGRAVGAAVEVCLEWSDVLIVAALRPPHEVGIYAVATRAVRPGQIVDRALRVALSPLIARHLTLAERDAATHLHARATRALVLLAWPFYVTLIAMGPAVLGIFGNEFVAGYPVLAVLAGAFLIANLGGMLQSIMLMGGRSSWQVYEKTLVLALSIAGNLLLVPRLGIMGAAITFAGVVLADVLIAGAIVHRGLKVQLQPLRTMAIGVLPLLVFGLAGLGMRSLLGDASWVLVPYLCVALSTYAALLWSLRRYLEIDGLLSRDGRADTALRLTPGPATNK